MSEQYPTSHSPVRQTDLNIIDRQYVRYKGVWLVADKNSGGLYYVKRAKPSEVDMTKRAGDFLLPEDSLLVLPEIPFAPEILPERILSEVLDWKDEYDPKNRRSAILITKAHPVPDKVPTLANDNLASALGNLPIKEEEYDRLIRDVRRLNEAGIFNHDFMSNLFPVRNEHGQVKFYAIDFEPDTFAKIYSGELEDVKQLEKNREELRQKGIIVPNDFMGTIEAAAAARSKKSIPSNPEDAPPKRPLKGALQKLIHALRDAP